MFKITRGKGFHIRFANGVTVSVQFGGGSYADHYNDLNLIGQEQKLPGLESTTAETAVWLGSSSGHWITRQFGGDDVLGYQTPEQVLELLNWAAKYKVEGGEQ